MPSKYASQEYTSGVAEPLLLGYSHLIPLAYPSLVHEWFSNGRFSGHARLSLMWRPTLSKSDDWVRSRQYPQVCRQKIPYVAHRMFRSSATHSQVWLLPSRSRKGKLSRHLYNRSSTQKSLLKYAGGLVEQPGTSIAAEFVLPALIKQTSPSAQWESMSQSPSHKPHLRPPRRLLHSPSSSWTDLTNASGRGV